MEFTCAHCQRPIYSIAVIMDKTHFVHEGCKEAYENRILLSEDDAKIFGEAIINPPKPNSVLKRAFERYKTLVR